MEKNTTKDRPPFVNAWLVAALSILAVCIVAPIAQGDAVTWIVWCACVALALTARAYQYFIQRR